MGLIFSPRPILQISKDWIVESDTNILWLFPDYRGIKLATWNRSLIIIRSSGGILFFASKKEESLSYRIRKLSFFWRVLGNHLLIYYSRIATCHLAFSRSKTGYITNIATLVTESIIFIAIFAPIPTPLRFDLALYG